MRPAVPLIALLAAGPAFAQVPTWWKAFAQSPRVEARFTQTGDSAVFGKLTRQGLLRIAKGGLLRVEYDKGLLLVADGKALAQYDASTRTAQKVELAGAVKDAPLLAVLMDPGQLERVYAAKAGPGPEAFTLEPRSKGLPAVVITGKGGMPLSLAWTDPTGAKQLLVLERPTVPAKAFPQGIFTFKAPAGTTWIRP